MSDANPMRSTGKRSVLQGLALALLPAISLAQSSPGQMVVFGDSLSDSGNVWLLTSEVSKAPFEPIAFRPYAIGGHHFSNGKTWVELLAQDLSIPSGAKPSLAKAAHFGNYAFGGARARANSGSLTPSSAQQIGLYLQASAGIVSEDTLHVLAFGGNDLRDAIVAAQTNPGAAMTIVMDAVAALISDIELLYGAGARHFLVANAPNLALAPVIQAAGAGAVAEFYSEVFGDLLEDGLIALEANPTYAGIDLRRLDMFHVLNDMVANPANYGILDPFTPCLTFFVKSGAKCDDAETRLFWDGIHPTVTGHRGLANAALTALGEP